MLFPSFDTYSLLSILVLSVAVQAVFFLFAALLATDKVTDLAYSLSFILLTAFLFVTQRAYHGTQILLAACIVAWGVRLGGYLFFRILHIKRDARFDGIRENPLRFAVFWAVQAFSVWLIMLPSTLYLSSGATPRWSPLTWIGVAIWMTGLAVETVADIQKYRFRMDQANEGRWIQHGLWRYSRHPNFFGEALCWWGLFVLVIPGLEGWSWLAAVGPVFITLLLLFGTGVPTVERRSEAKYGQDPAFRSYKRNTSIFVPLPPRKDSS